jgi:hypothetical protein
MEVLSTHGLLHKCREVAVHCMMSVRRTWNGLFNGGEADRRMRANN